MVDALNHKISIPFIYPSTFYKLTKVYRGEKKALKRFKEFLTDIMTNRRLALKQIGDNNNEENVNEKLILIDRLILNEEKFTDAEITEHFVQFLLGYEVLGVAQAHTVLMHAL